MGMPRLMSLMPLHWTILGSRNGRSSPLTALASAPRVFPEARQGQEHLQALGIGNPRHGRAAPEGAFG